jgi:hypothetical protein
MQKMTNTGNFWSKDRYLRNDVTGKENTENVYVFYLQNAERVLTASVQSFARHKS